MQSFSKKNPPFGCGTEIVLISGDVLACLSGELRPEMLEAIRRCRERLRTGLITNNILAMTHDADLKQYRQTRA